MNNGKMAVKEKKFHHERYQKCKITGEDIDTQSERYVILLDCDGDAIFDKGFYKLENFKQVFTGNWIKLRREVEESLRQKINTSATSAFSLIKQRLGNMVNG